MLRYKLFGERGLAIGALAALLFSFVPAPALAATTVDDFSVRPTSIEPGVASNYRLYVTVPSTIPEGDTLSLVFHTGFTLTGIDEDDIDISDDGVQLETAASCGGTVDAAVTRSSQTISFAFCVGGGGQITAGSDIAIVIGTVATSYGTGDSTITNPTTSGRSYGVSFSTVTNAMTGSSLIAIASNDDGAVSATTPAVAPGGGPGPGGGPPAPEPTRSVQVMTPNGGESYRAGDVVTIQWQTAAPSSTYVNVRYSTDGGVTYRPIVENAPNVDQYLWTIPDVTTSTALVRVEMTDLATIAAEDVSDAFFSIQGIERPFVTALSPSGLDIRYRGDLVTFLWRSSATVSHVDLQYSEDRGGTWLPLALKVVHTDPENGRFATTLNNAPNPLFYWRVIGYDVQGGAYREIARSASVHFDLRDRPVDDVRVRVVSPNGGESYVGGQTVGVLYETGRDIEAVDIALSLNGGASWMTYAAGITPAGEYSMALPSTATTSALVRVQGSRAGRVVTTDVSDAVFAITVPIETVEPTPETEPEPVAVPPDPDSGALPEPEPVVVTDGPLSVGVETPVGSLSLPIIDGRVEILRDPGSRVIATISDVEPRSVTYVLPSRTLTPVRLRDGVYASDVAVDFATSLQVKAQFAGSQRDATVLLVPVGYGRVQTTTRGDVQPVEGARVTVYRNGVTYDASRYGWSNPMITGVDGGFGGYVENGSYRIVVEKEGYVPAEDVVMVANNILNPVITLRTPEEVMADAEANGEVLGEGPALVPLADRIATVIDDPRVERVAEVTSVTIVAPVALATAVALGAWFQAASLLQYLFAAPLLLFTSRRRNAFGVVYHAVTKKPLPLATVRLFTAEGKLVRSVVTDFQGRFYLRAKPGLYEIKVMKTGFIFPSELMAGVPIDGRYADVYTGGRIEIGDHTITAAINIPLDPVGRTETDIAVILRRRRVERFRRVAVQLLAPLGLLASLIVVIVQPTPVTIVLVAVQALSYVGSIFLVRRPDMKKGFAIVRDGMRRSPVQHAFVRLFDTRYNKLVETTVTDERGRYAFLAGPSVYDLAVEHPAYERADVKGVEVVPAKRLRPVAVNVELSAKQSHQNPL